MDGHFVPNISFGLPVISAIRDKTQLPFDVHLMIDNPMDFIDDFVKAGADSITVHVEVLPHLHRAIQYIKDKGVSAGVALNPSTPLNVLDYVLEDVDMILLMTVNPGFGGQRLIPAILNKIAQLRKRLDERGLKTDIQVDGGVYIDNIHEIAKAGANIFVAGSAIFNADDPKQMISDMRKRAEKRMKVLIISGGDLGDPSWIRKNLPPYDYAICADGGIRYLDLLGIDVDLIVGILTLLLKIYWRTIKSPKFQLLLIR